MEIHDKIMELFKKHNIDWEQNIDLAKDIKELALQSNIKTLKQSVFTVGSMKSGHKCPVCEQKVKMYKKQIDAHTASFLIKLYNISNKQPFKTYFHVNDDIRVSNKVGGSWAKLRYWGLIEEQQNSYKNTHRRTTGMWKITEKGRMFVEEKIPIEKYVKLYNQKCYGFDGGDVWITDSLKQKFDYREMMSL